MFKQATGRVGLLGLMMGAAFLPYDKMNVALPALMLGDESNNKSANFSVGLNNDNYFNQNINCTDFDYGVCRYNLYVENSNHADLISFGFDYAHPSLAFKPMKETEKESNIAILAKKLSGVLQGTVNVISSNGAVMVGGFYFFKDATRFGPKRALFNTVQGYIEVPAILHYFGSYVDSGLACVEELGSNVLNTITPYFDEYAAPLAKSVFEFGADVILSQENQKFCFDLLAQAGEYVPSFSKISKLGVGAGLGLGLGKVIDWYKKVDVRNRV